MSEHADIPAPGLKLGEEPPRIPDSIEGFIAAIVMGAAVRHHVRQRAGALLHQRLVRVHRGILGGADGGDGAGRHRRRLLPGTATSA